MSSLSSRVSIDVRFCETDLMGIVHHANYFTYFEAGRVDWLRRRGVSYQEWAALGIHLPVIEAGIRYRRAARFDDRIVVESTMGALTRVTVRFDYRILRQDEVLCEGETLLACVGDDMGPRRIPPEVREILQSPELEELAAR